MINFFRGLRRRLLAENNVSRYLLYAVGEIILVVIGILIALQINNWNQDRLDRNEEQNYYRNIKRQLTEDQHGIIGSVDYNNLYLAQYGYATGIIAQNDRTAVDTLAKITLNLMKTSDFHRQSNIYESLVNSGEIKLLRNQEIIEGLQRLEETYIYMNKLEETHSQAVMTFIVPRIVGTIRVMDMTVEDQDRMYTSEFQNQFTLLSTLMVEKNEIYTTALDRIETLNDLIDAALGSDAQ